MDGKIINGEALSMRIHAFEDSRASIALVMSRFRQRGARHQNFDNDPFNSFLERLDWVDFPTIG